MRKSGRTLNCLAISAPFSSFPLYSICRALLSFSGLPNTCLLREVLRSLIYVLSDKIDASSSMSMCGYHDQTGEALLSVKDYERKKARQERA